MEIVIAVVALLVSIASSVWTIRQNREMARTARLANLTNIVDIERSLGAVPSALRFHGINATELADAGITPQEFAYLLASCTATAFYHNASDENPDEPFAAGSYRGAMCVTPDFQRAWPLLKRMFNQGVFVSRIDATIAAFRDPQHAGTTAGSNSFG